MKAFGDKAVLIVFGLITAGGYMLFEIFASISEMFSSSYGLVILFKLSLVIAILGIAAINRIKLTIMFTTIWEEVAVYNKISFGRTYDTFRVYTNDLGQVKGRSDRQGQEFYFKDRESLRSKIKSLRKLKFQLRSGELPKKVVSPVWE